MISPDQVVANLNRILRLQGKEPNIQVGHFAPTNATTSRVLKTFEEYPAQLLRDFIDEGNSRLGGFVAKGTVGKVLPMPGGGIRILIGMCVLMDDAKEGVDFTFWDKDSVTPLVITCAKCGHAEAFPATDYRPDPFAKEKQYWSSLVEKGWRTEKGKRLCIKCSGKNRHLRRISDGALWTARGWDAGEPAKVFTPPMVKSVIRDWNGGDEVGYRIKWSADEYEWVKL